MSKADKGKKFAFKEITCPKCGVGSSDPDNSLKVVERVYRYRNIRMVDGENGPFHIVGDDGLHGLVDTEEDTAFDPEVVCMDCGGEAFGLPDGFWETADWE